MSKDKVEGFLMGIGVGIVAAAFLQGFEQFHKKRVDPVTGENPAEKSGRDEAPARPPNQSLRASHA